MFFCLSKTRQQNFPFNHECENFVVSLDEGWHHTQDSQGNKIWFKGYVDDGILAEQIPNIIKERTPQTGGNFCIIKIVPQGCFLYTSSLRSFPLYHTGDSLTNLQPAGDLIWADNIVMLRNDMTLARYEFDAVGYVDDSLIDLEDLLQRLDVLLADKVQKFVKSLNGPLRVFLSGGIDTALLYSYVKKCTANYELVLCNHVDYDYFYVNNHSTLSQFWAYNQIHHWREDCVLASGAPGDEFMLRNPGRANLLLMHYGSSILQLLDDPKYADSLHYNFFSSQSYIEHYKKQALDFVKQPLTEVIRTTCKHNINDWQHWHLGRTLTWTPFRDLDIWKLFARLDPKDLPDQIMNSIVQKELIRRNDSKILGYLSEKKNYKNSLKNLSSLL